MAGAIGSTSTLASGSRTNSTVTAPTGITNGDYLLAFVAAGDANDQTAPTVTGPAGFTKVTGSPFQISKADPFATGINIFWKIAASESGNYTFTHGAATSQALMYRLTGTGTSGPTVTTASGTGKTATATGLTTTTNGAVVIYGAILWDGGPGTQPAGTTPTFTERLDTGALYFADGVLATAGATGNKANATAFTAQSVISPYNAILVAVEAPSSGSVNGTFGITIDPVTQSVTGQVLVQGSLAQTISAVTQSATGQLLVKGSLAGTIDPVALSASANVIVKGSLAQTIPAVTQTATGQVVLNGSLAQTIAPVTLSANGSVVIQGSFGQTIDPVTLTASGSSASGGALNATIDPVTLSATGAVIIQGNFGQTIAPVTQAATGALVVKGTFGQTIDPVTLAASGSAPGAINATLAATIGPVTLAATGAVVIQGVFGQVIDPVTLTAAGGTIPDANNGSLSQTIGEITLLANGFARRDRGGDGGTSPVRIRRKYRFITRDQLQTLLQTEEEAPVITPKRVAAIKKEIVKSIEAKGSLGPAKAPVAEFVQRELQQAFEPEMDMAAIREAVEDVMSKAAEEAERIEAEIEEEDEFILLMVA